MAKDFDIRPAYPEDLNFILATFSKSMKSESSIGRATSNRVFFAGFLPVIDYILDHSLIDVACSKDDENAILGYLIFEPPDIIHFTYVKEAFQRFGIAKELIKEAYPDAKALYFTCSTKDAKRINEKYSELIYDPFKLFIKGAA